MVSLIIGLLIVGVVLWLVNTYVPLDPKIRTIINVVVGILVVLWVLRAFGLVGGNLR